MEPAYAERYGSLEDWHWWFRGRQRILTAVLGRALAGQPVRTLCSVGCGPPEGAAWLSRFVATDGRLLSLDLDARHARTVGPRHTHLVGDLRCAPIASRTLDVLVALDVLEHLADDAAGLREAARVLAPGGLLLATVPAFPSLWGPQDVVSHHRRRYTRATLRAAFARAGLPPPFVTHFNTWLFPAAAGLRWLRRALGTADPNRSDFDDNHPGLVNDLLETLFASERHVVGRIPLPVGVSLLATVRTRA